ncbi:MAG: ABC transporter permease, partial [bacterium]|nr:ABC transporter permease [bacterium]
MNELVITGRRFRLLSDRFKKFWFKFSRSSLSIIGLIISTTCVILAVLAPYIVPYPEHIEWYIDYDNALRPPNLEHILGTDQYGRDVFSRIIFGMRYSFTLVVVVLSIVIPTGIVLGVLAGYFKDTWFDYLIMRISDTFVAVPPLVMALAIAAVLKPSMINSMIAVSLTWWPWYARLTYSAVSSLKNEYYIIYSEVIGVSKLRVMFVEILPNCIGCLL